MKFKINEKVVLSYDEGEVILLNMQNGNFFGLDKLGSEIWQLIQKDMSNNQIVEHMLSNYQVDEVTAIKDIQNFINDLLDGGIITSYEQNE